MKSELNTLQKERELLLLMKELQKSKNEWNSLYFTYQHELGEIKTRQKNQQEGKQKIVNSLYRHGVVSLKIILFMIANLLIMNTIAPYPPYYAIFSTLYDLATFVLAICIIQAVVEKALPLLIYPVKNGFLKQQEKELELQWHKRLQKKQEEIEKLYYQTQEMKAEVSYLYSKDYINEQLKNFTSVSLTKDTTKQKVKKRNLNH